MMLSRKTACQPTFPLPLILRIILIKPKPGLPTSLSCFRRRLACSTLRVILNKLDKLDCRHSKHESFVVCPSASSTCPTFAYM